MKEGKNTLVFLTGFMGSGKSTIAPIVANTLGYEFLDIDGEIERLIGKSVAEIFQTEGEEYFRMIERSILREMSEREGCVISLGGGTITNVENLALVKSSGVLVYLKSTPDQIFKRMKAKTDRPMLLAPDGSRLGRDDLYRRIEVLLAARELFYAQADVTIMSDEKRVGATVDEVVKHIKSLIE